MTRKHLAIVVILGAAVLCGGRSIWRANHPDPVEAAHAAALPPLPAGAPSAEPSAWLASFFPAPEGPAGAGHCATCHAAEAAAWAASAHATTVSCAGCHVREGSFHGPGAAPAEPAPAGDPAPMPAASAPASPGGHAPSTPHAEFRSAAFCASCHDDGGAVTGGEGKPRSELTAEWQRTPAALRGDTCQSCHMPDGAHTWRGFGHVELVRGAFTARAKFISDGQQMVGKLTVTATEAVGHRLPSGISRELRLTIDQLDHAGLILEGTHREGVLGRRLDPTGTTELFDTRLLPGEAHELPYIAALEAECAVVRSRVSAVVDPSHPDGEVVWEDKVLIPG